MDAKRMKVVHVFEENVCRICAQAGVHLYYNINENFIQYKNVYISFLEIIKDVLNFEVNNLDYGSFSLLISFTFRLIKMMANQWRYVIYVKTNLQTFIILKESRQTFERCKKKAYTLQNHIQKVSLI